MEEPHPVSYTHLDFPDACDDFLFEIVSQRMDMVSFWQNPLFKKTILSHIDYKNE